MKRAPTLLVKYSSVIWLLLGLLIFQSAGWQLAWQCMHWGARLEASRVLFAGTLLPERTFSKTHFNSIQVDRKEIRLDGHLYDFRKVSETPDSIRVMLYHDLHEQVLLSTLDKWFKKAEESGTPSTAGLIKWLAQNLGASFLPPCPGILSIPKSPACLMANFPTFSWGAQCTPGVFAPPPEEVI